MDHTTVKLSLLLILMLIVLHVGSSYSHNGPLNEHKLLFQFDKETNTIYIFRGLKGQSLNQYIIKLNALLQIVEVKLNGHDIDPSETNIKMLSNKYKRILIFGEHGEYVTFNPYRGN